MKIEIGNWVQLKSDANEVYLVCRKSTSNNFLECRSLGGKRIVIDEDEVELITDKERLADLELHQTSSSFF